MYTYVCMKIFFTASFEGKKKYQKSYDMILNYIEELGHEVVSPEKGNYKKLLSKKDLEQSEKAVHYSAIKKGILWADAVVLEISTEDFQLGHEATLAIQNKKPVLCLSRDENYAEKIKDRYFFGGKYNQFNFEELIENFLTKVEKQSLNRRFNLFLSERQFELLQKKANENKVSISEYLRSLIE